jgi:membrane carboxypeptidase/penicillin-binding protein
MLLIHSFWYHCGRGKNNPVFLWAVTAAGERYDKTITTDYHVYALFIGFAATLVVKVWMARDRRSRIGPRKTGASTALPLEDAFMAHVPAPGMRVASARIC